MQDPRFGDRLQNRINLERHITCATLLWPRELYKRQMVALVSAMLITLHLVSDLEAEIHHDDASRASI